MIQKLKIYSIILNLFFGFSTAFVIKRTYVGCFKDTSVHDLTGPLFSSNSLTHDLCQKFCSDRNFTYFGAQNK